MRQAIDSSVSRAEPRLTKGTSLLICFLLFGRVALAQQPEARSAAKCSIEGRVVREGTDDGIKKARVALFGGMGMFGRPDNPSETAVPRPGVKFTVTNSDGQFRFENVDAGEYRLTAERPGFTLGSDHGRKAGRGIHFLSLKPGEQVSDIVVLLAPAGVITGRVFDPDGDPVPRANVSVLSHAPRGGNDAQSPVEYTETNDFGEFRIFDLRPGKYYVRATLRDGRTDVFRKYESKDDVGHGSEDVAPAYYPSTSDPRRAEAIEVLPGLESRVDLTLSVIRTFTIRGRVTRMPEGKSKREVMVFARPADSGPNSVPFDGMAMLGRISSEFAIPKVPAGSYFVIAVESEEGDGEVALGRVRVNVASHDVDNIVISLSGGSEISGKVRFEGTPPTSLAEFYVSLQPTGGETSGERGAYGKVNADGSFKLGHVFDGEYWVSIGAGLGEHYLKSAHAGKDDCTRTPVRVSGGVPVRLELVVAKGQAVITGSVRNAQGNPVPGAAILLMDEYAPKTRRFAVLPAQTDINGAFQMQNLPPGIFYAIAVEQDAFDWEASGADIDFERLIKELSKRVHLATANSSETVELIIISKSKLSSFK